MIRKRQNPIYTEFLKEIPERNYEKLSIEDFPDIREESHGSDKDSFKEAYVKASQNLFTTVYHLDDANRLRVGFVESIEKGLKENGGWYQIWHTVRIQAWRTGSKSDPSYNFDFHQSLTADIEELERIERKRLDDYIPLHISSLNSEDYYYLGDGVKLFTPEYKRAREKWYGANDDRSFCEFLEDFKLEERK